MNAKQLNKVEAALMGALSYMVARPEKDTPGAKDEYGVVIDDLRSAINLVRTWRALMRSANPTDTTETELPGQMHIPGVDPCEKP